MTTRNENAKETPQRSREEAVDATSVEEADFSRVGGGPDCRAVLRHEAGAGAAAPDPLAGDAQAICRRYQIDLPKQAAPFAATLAEAMAKPAVGKPRRPSKIRVADMAYAAELREAFSDIEVVVAPTPEIDEVVEELAEFDMEAAPPPLGYLDGVSPELMAEHFELAKLLYGLKPWERGACNCPLRLDIPALGCAAPASR